MSCAHNRTRCARTDLDYGVLSFSYLSLFVNDSRPTCYQSFFPITPHELGPGWIFSAERAITKHSMVVHHPNATASSSARVVYFGVGGFLLTEYSSNYTGTAAHAVGVRVEGNKSLAVVVWDPQ